jgi:hypothetical protein
MKWLVRILGAVLAAGLLSTGVAVAASLGLSTSKVGAKSVAVTGCTSSSLSATRNVDNSGNVTQVNVLSVPQACAGETLAVTLEDNSGASLASVSTVVGACTGGCTVSFTGFGTVSAVSLAAYALSLTQ